MKINLIASPNGTLFMAWDNGKNQYPVVVADFSRENVALANELALLYNNQQEQNASAPDNVVAMPQKEVKKREPANP